MRILVVQETDWIRRNTIQHHRMLEQLSAEGHEVVVLDFPILWEKDDLPSGWVPRQMFHNVRKIHDQAHVTVVRPVMLRVPGLGRLSWLASNWPEFHRLFREFKPDVVVAYSISNALMAQRLAERYGVPFVYHLLDALYTLVEPSSLRPIAKRVERLVLRHAKQVIVLNKRLGEYAIEMGASADAITVLPAGVTISDASTEGAGMRSELGFKDSDVVLFFMGWLYPFSGLREVVMALARHKQALPNVKLLIVGEGDLFAELEALRETHALEGQVVLTGSQPAQEMPAYIAASDICLLPAHANDTMRYIVPAKVTEYMQHGKPVIATRLPGLVAEFGELPGLLYIEEPSQVMEKVKEMFEDAADPRETARRLGQTCLNYMARQASWNEVTQRFEEILLHAGGGATLSVATSSLPSTQNS